MENCVSNGVTSLSKKESLKDGQKMVNDLEEALKVEDNRNKLDGLLQSFAVLQRDELLTRITSFVRYIEKITGENTSNAFLQLLSISLPELEEYLSYFKNKEVQNWLREINFKYISRFEGIFPPFPHDWYRILWSNRIDFTHGNIPILELKILKRNGEMAYLETAFPTAVKLTNYILNQILEGKNNVAPEFKASILTEIEKTKQIVESILKE